MKYANAFAAAVAAVSLSLAGCEETEPTTPPVPAPVSSSPVPAGGMTETLDNAKDQTGTVLPKVENAVEDTKDAVADTQAAAVKQAEDLYSKAMEAMKNMTPDKLPEISGYVTQLEGLKDKLPVEWQTRIADLVKQLNDARSNVPAIPSMPGMPK